MSVGFGFGKVLAFGIVFQIDAVVWFFGFVEFADNSNLQFPHRCKSHISFVAKNDTFYHSQKPCLVNKNKLPIYSLAAIAPYL